MINIIAIRLGTNELSFDQDSVENGLRWLSL